MSRKRFIDGCLDGSYFLSEIDDAVEAWHDSDTSAPIWRFLGMRKSEYRLWVERPESLRFIVAAHARDTEVADVLRSGDRQLVAARADHPDDARKVIAWLEQTGRLG
ncbi:MAG: hypothetical protein JWO77_3046 [Ilumatobacteraceae bacterium]|nr:hypothetical protein [Ilumatobacteraceae bacterium]